MSNSNDITSTKQFDSVNQEAGGGWMRRLVRGWRARKKARTIARLRAHMAFFGYDVSNLSDEEIEEGVRSIAAKVSACGISAKEAAEGLQAVSKAMSRPTFPPNQMIRESGWYPLR